MTREEDVPAAVPSVTPADDTGPLRTELTRCQQLGEAATRDQFCLRAWADNRRRFLGIDAPAADRAADTSRSEEHTPELQSLMSNSYAVFCLQKQTQT